MKTTIKKGIINNEMILTMNIKIDLLRKSIWNTIHKNKGNLSNCDICMALGIINYELIHHQ